MINHLRMLLEQAKNSCGNPPLVGLVGFGTWAKIIGSIQPNVLPDVRRQDGLSDYLVVDQTRIMRDPYCEDGLIVFVQCEGKTADVRIFEGLELEHPKVVLR